MFERSAVPSSGRWTTASSTCLVERPGMDCERSFTGSADERMGAAGDLQWCACRSGTLATVTAARGFRRPDVTTVEMVGGIEKHALVLADYDPQWPEAYAEQKRRIRAALGPAAVQIEHIGSTSVPGLAAKPVIDVLVTVEDIAAEEDYLDQLLDVGYELRVREPGHRLVRTPARDVLVHCALIPRTATCTCVPSVP
jgi:hypothetical protein